MCVNFFNRRRTHIHRIKYRYFEILRYLKYTHTFIVGIQTCRQIDISIPDPPILRQIFPHCHVLAVAETALHKVRFYMKILKTPIPFIIIHPSNNQKVSGFHLEFGVSSNCTIPPVAVCPQLC
jgi:hypothetical protein